MLISSAKMNRLFYIFFIIPLYTFAQFSITDLKTDYQIKPLGSDNAKPVFSWRMVTSPDLREQFQKAYSIQVTDEVGDIVWDSGKIENSASIGISYKGEKLIPATRYSWKVKVWNQDGNTLESDSWFETGLMNSDPKLSAWSGADWIGGGDKDLVFFSHYLTVYKFRYDVQLDQKSKSTRASFIFGANDERLMNKNRNTENLVSKKDESFVKLELDISKVDGSETGKARLNIYRTGYSKDDKLDYPIQVLVIPLTIINKKNKYDKHQVQALSIFGVFDFYIDGNDPSHCITKNKEGKMTSINLNPAGWGADYIAYPIVGDIGFSLEKGQKASFSNVAIMNNRAPSSILFQEDLNQSTAYSGIFKEADKKVFHITDGQYFVDASTKPLRIIANPTQNGSPMLRTKFNTAEKSIKKARIYATARGIYELYLNGHRIGDDYFSPGLTQYNKTQLYQTYDVTAQLLSGSANALGAVLSEGWWSGNITFTGNHWNFFGDRQSLLAKLVITYEDGSEQIITTNPDTWKYFNKGPISYGSFFQGEVYDSRKELSIAGWDTSNYDDSNWTKAYTVNLKGTAYLKDSDNQDGLDFSNLHIEGMPGVTATIVKKVKPVAVQEVRPGVFVYDMGQNMVGFPKIELDQTSAGDTIMMRYAEIKYPDLKQYSQNKGMVMLENLRAAMVRDIYYCKGSKDVYQPRFTYHGFRYIEITGIKKALPLENVTGMVLSSIDSISSGYETSNTAINKLWKNIEWSTRANFLYIPTDTPARNERMGWSGDISVFSKTATYMADVAPFLRRHMLAMRDLQYENGRFTDTAPVTDAFGGILWGSAGIVVAWESYQQYGDTALLEEHYDAMKKYIDFIRTTINPATGIINEGPLGDWLSPENYKNDDTILWDAYYVYDLDIMRQVATVLKKNEDAADFEREYKSRKDHFNKTHIDTSTGKTVHSGHRFPWGYNISEDKLPKKGDFCDTQASYAVPLAFNVIDEKLKTLAAVNLVSAISRKNIDQEGVSRNEYSLMTGFIGTAAVSKALSMNGFDKTAYALMQQTSYPSWLYSVENGATTIWERLNSFTKENGFGTNNSMNSFNHYSFGAVGSWMINYSLGIEREEPGFKKIILQPTPDLSGKMTFAKGYYNSMYGPIKSEWRIEKGQTVYFFQVPANTTATLYLLSNDIKKIKENGREIKKLKGIVYQGNGNGRLKLSLSSGIYKFIVLE
jgi:alpha-L-rhamnosidase